MNMEERKWDVGEMVVVHTLNDLVGEVTKRSLNGDGEYDYMVHYDRDGSIEWSLLHLTYSLISFLVKSC